MHLHHIIPKHEWKKRFGSLEGVDVPENVIELTVEQHAECHRWLFEQYGCWEDRCAFEALSGLISNEEVYAQATRLSKLGKPRSAETKEKCRLANLGRGLSAETRAKVSQALKGRTKPPRSESHRENLRRAKTGMKLAPRTEEHKRNISLSRIGKSFSSEHKKNIGLAQIGRKASEETKDKMSIASKAQWQKRKNAMMVGG
jgi:hypothetical protein